jgi:murein L,D-transpeptidase YafK
MKTHFFSLCLLFVSFTFNAFSQKNALETEEKHERVADAKKYADSTWRRIFKEKNLVYPPKEILTRVFKDEEELEIWAKGEKDAQFTLVKTFKICAMSGSAGPKRKRGDMQVPEGFYQIEYFNPDSNFLLSVLVSYPNTSDRYFTKKLGYKDAGGQICIHGYCASIGCVAIENEPIMEYYWLYFMVRKNGQKFFPVHIFPFRFDKVKSDERKTFSEKADILTFWQNIEEGFLYFEKNKKLPSFSFGKAGEYIFQK